MNRDELLDILRSGVDSWNAWRRDTMGLAQARIAERWRVTPSSPAAFPDLSNACLEGMNLIHCELSHCNLTRANLAGTNLTTATLRKANLQSADLSGAVLDMADLEGSRLVGANLVGANLHGAFLLNADLTAANLATAVLVGAHCQQALFRKASLYAANLIQADLQWADLRESDLQSSLMVDANVEGALFSGCSIYGLSAWRVKGIPAEQRDLLISPPDESKLTVSELQMAQFIYLLRDNKTLRGAIDTITSKLVLVLGRFTPERKAVLDAIRQELGKRDYLPVVFDFDKPATRDTHETVTTLARMARFVIADITDPKSIPQELVSIVEQLPSLPVQPILHEGEEPWAMHDHIRRYPWVLEIRRYGELASLLPSLNELVIAPAEQKVREIRSRA